MKYVLEALVEDNYYDSKERTLYLQRIILQGLIIKQRKSCWGKWSPEFHIKGVRMEIMNNTSFAKTDFENCF